VRKYSEILKIKLLFAKKSLNIQNQQFAIVEPT